MGEGEAGWEELRVFEHLDVAADGEGGLNLPWLRIWKNNRGFNGHNQGKPDVEFVIHGDAVITDSLYTDASNHHQNAMGVVIAQAEENEGIYLDAEDRGPSVANGGRMLYPGIGAGEIQCGAAGAACQRREVNALGNNFGKHWPIAYVNVPAPDGFHNALESARATKLKSWPLSPVARSIRPLLAVFSARKRP